MRHWRIIETLVRSNFFLEHIRIKWTKNEFPEVVLVKYIILKKIKIWVQRSFKPHKIFDNIEDNTSIFKLFKIPFEAVSSFMGLKTKIFALIEWKFKSIEEGFEEACKPYHLNEK